MILHHYSLVFQFERKNGKILGLFKYTWEYSMNIFLYKTQYIDLALAFLFCFCFVRIVFITPSTETLSPLSTPFKNITAFLLQLSKFQLKDLEWKVKRLSLERLGIEHSCLLFQFFFFLILDECPIFRSRKAMAAQRNSD